MKIILKKDKIKLKIKDEISLILIVLAEILLNYI